MPRTTPRSSRLTDGKKRTNSSRRWLLRQLNDPFVQAAQKQGYRSRAAFKLLQLDEKFKIFRKKQRIVDLGCAPGGWLQVVLEQTKVEPPRTHPDPLPQVPSEIETQSTSPQTLPPKPASTKFRIVGVDLLPIEPLPGVYFIEGDFLEAHVVEQIFAALEGPADVILSDMAASSSGHPATDHLKIMALLEAVIDFAENVLASGGTLVAKVIQGGSEKQLLQRLKQLFDKVDHAKPEASRKESAELYVIARGFKNGFKKRSQKPSLKSDPASDLTSQNSAMPDSDINVKEPTP